jgi:uncharacterized protein (DUF305 family)
VTGHYGKLTINLMLSAIVMYFVMYTMIDSTADLYNNLNNAYMTAMMVAPMAILMLVLMGSMYTNRRANLALYALFGAMFAFALIGMRSQALIADRQFLRSMIPHHSGAVLMCEKASLKDAEIVSLCARIVKSQKEEIAQMKAILARL